MRACVVVFKGSFRPSPIVQLLLLGITPCLTTGNRPLPVACQCCMLHLCAHAAVRFSTGEAVQPAGFGCAFAFLFLRLLVAADGRIPGFPASPSSYWPRSAASSVMLSPHCQGSELSRSLTSFCRNVCHRSRICDGRRTDSASGLPIKAIECERGGGRAARAHVRSHGRCAPRAMLRDACCTSRHVTSRHVVADHAHGAAVGASDRARWRLQRRGSRVGRHGTGHSQ